jgi:hypothetical protein
MKNLIIILISSFMILGGLNSTHAIDNTQTSKELKEKQKKKSSKKTKKKYKMKRYSWKKKKKAKKKRYKRKMKVSKKAVKKEETGFFSETLRYVDFAQQYISSGWIGFNHDIDMYFSGQRYSKSKNQSQILLSYQVHKSESAELEKSFDFGVRIHLPKISKKLSFVIKKERDEILEAESTQVAAGVNKPERGYSAGIKYALKQMPFFTTTLDTGIKLDMPLDPFIKLKTFKIKNTKIVNIYFGQKFIYYRQEANLRSITEFSLTKKISKTFSITQGNSLTWTDERDKFNLRNFLSLGQNLNNKSALSYTIGANGIFEPSYHYDIYDASVTYMSKLYKNWFSGRLITGSTFDKNKNWSSSAYVTLRFDALIK